MNSLVFFFTLALYQWADLRAPEHLEGWIQGWFGRVAHWLKPESRRALLLAVAVPLVLAAVLLLLADDGLFGWLALILGVIYLWVALGRQRFQLGSESVPVAGSVCSLIAVDEAYHNHLYGWFQSLFLVLFWTLLLGPVAGLLVYLLRQWLLLRPSAFGIKCWALVEWLPARLMVLSFAAVGSFSHCMEVWRDAWLNWRFPVDEMLVHASRAALGEKNDTDSPEYLAELKELHALLVRTLVLWVVLVALLVLI